jgi:hypothetical protein
LTLAEERRRADITLVEQLLAAAQQEVEQLREEVSDLRGAVRAQLGQQRRRRPLGLFHR